MIVFRAAWHEGKFSDQQRYGESDAGQDSDTKQVTPPQGRVEAHPGDPGHQPGGGQNADRLAHDKSRDDGDGERIGQRGDESCAPADRDTSGEEREHRDCNPSGQRPETVLELFGQTGAVAWSTVSLAVPDWDGEPEQNAGDGGVDSRGMHKAPGNDPDRQQDHPRRDRTEVEEPPIDLRDHSIDRNGCEREKQRNRVQRIAIEDRDDADGNQIIDYRQSQQKDPQRTRQMGANQRQNSDREGEIGCGGNGPAMVQAGIPAGDCQIDQCRHGHPTRGRGNRHDCGTEMP